LLSPVILDNIDVREITNEHLTNVSVADALAVSKVKIFQNNNLLYFLVKFPKPKVVCKKLMIYYVRHNNVILDLDQHNTSRRNNLLQNLGDTKSSHLQPVVMVDEGMLIINDVAANITGGNTHQNIAGTFLINFDDQISLNGLNHHGVLKKTPAVPDMAKINITEHHQLLSLPFMYELEMMPLTPT